VGVAHAGAPPQELFQHTSAHFQPQDEHPVIHLYSQPVGLVGVAHAGAPPQELFQHTSAHFQPQDEHLVLHLLSASGSSG
jgi:hypothetical protein